MVERFSAQVDDWVTKSKLLSELVFRSAVRKMLNDAQTPKAKGGRMPVDTGNLRNSHTCGLNGSTWLTGPDSYQMVLSKAELGDVVEGGWTAPYARRIEMGFTGTDSKGRAYSQEPTFFLRGAAQKWQTLVYQEANRLKRMLR